MAIKEGMKVRVKDWETLVRENEEYTVKDRSEIDREPYFCGEMQKFCGKELEVAEVDEDGAIWLKDGEDGSDGAWQWAEWMLEVANG